MGTYRREYNGESLRPVSYTKKAFRIPVIQNIILLACISFLLGRATILGSLTPFGIAFFSYFLIKDRKYFYLGISTLLGIATAGVSTQILKYFAAIFLSYAVFTLIREKIRNKTLYVAGISSMIMFSSGLIFLLTSDFYVYDLFIVGFESIVVFVFVYILSYAVPIFIQKNNRKILSGEELVGVAIFMAVAVSGLSDILIAGCSIKRIVGILLTMIFAYYGGSGIGTSVGVTIGLVSSMSSIGTPAVIGTYGFCGLLAGIFRELGKMGSGIGMILGNIIMTFYISRFTEATVQFQEVAVAFILFLFMPKLIMGYIEKLVNSTTGENQINRIYSDRIKDITYQKIKKYGDAFLELANTYGNIAEKNKIIEQDEIAEIVDQVAIKLCSTCGMCRSCWYTNFYHTYQGIVDILVRLESYEKITLDNTPEVFKKRCIKIDSLVNTVEEIFYIYYIQYEWQKKLFENRQLISEQFEGISQILVGLADEVNGKVRFNTQIEDEIYVAMDKEGISVNKVTVLERENEKFEIEIERRPCFGRLQCKEKMLPIVSKTIGKPLVRKRGHCKIERDSDICSFSLTEAQNYQIALGTARISKDKQGISGDNYSRIDLADDKSMIVLSDGMGSGEKAAKESSATVAILEQLMEAGFHKDIAIKTVNSILVTKSSDEIFATMDLTIFDLYTGKVEFVKIGAAPSFIKRKNGVVETIKSTSLPIGILEKVDIESFGKKMESGDFLIMVSDGVLDAEKEMENREEWIANMLEEMNDRNPQTIADQILDTAIKKYQNKIEDDMTVLVAKIWKTR